MKAKTSISPYWKCQLIGWSLASLYWVYQGYLGENFKLGWGLLEFISDVVVYILITHLYRNIALSYNWPQLGLSRLLKRIIPAAVILGVVYTAVTLLKLYFFHKCINPAFSQPFSLFVKLNCLNLFITGIRLMSIWLLAYHMYHYAKREISIAKENARLEIISRDAQLNNLSAQLNPHFLFNSLNNIKALVIENPKSARRGIDLLSDLLRTALHGGEISLIPLQDELNMVKDYLELEKLRFEERLSFCIQTDETLNNLPVLRLSIQTLVENAVKHGIDKQKEGGLISINIENEGGFTKIEVQNPGQIKANGSANGVGLKNLRERLRLTFRGKASFNITDQQEGTVLSTMLIPLV